MWGVGSGLILFAVLAAPLAAQSRDSLVAGRRAYERAELGDATRLLPLGLIAPQPRDTAWSSGAHMLLDALLEQGRDSLAMLWARWTLRQQPGFTVDSATFPPRVARLFDQSRAAVGDRVLDSTAAAQVTWEIGGDAAGNRGQIRFARGSNAEFAGIEGIGTLLRGESRSLNAGTYTLRFGGGSSPGLTLEIPPGVTAVVMSRPAAVAAARPPAPPPPPVITVRGATAAAASHTTCLVLSSGPACWGGTDSLAALTLIEREVAVLSVGSAHTCGLTRSGAAVCWGSGINGQLGNGVQGPGTASAVPVSVSGNRVLVTLAAGGAHTCALTAEGAAFCWGANRVGELGNRSEAPSPLPVAVSMPQGVRFSALAAGTAHTCALTTAGAAWCWGANENGQLGNGGSNASSQPVAVQAPATFKEISAGNAHTCALTTAGAAWCWGAAGSGQLGDGGGEREPPFNSRPVAVTGGLTFSAIESGDWHSCGITTDGATYCWGAGRAGQLGNGQSSDSPRPVLVVGGQTFRTLSLGQTHSCGFTSSGGAWCWGDNTLAQLGSMGGRMSAVPVPVLLRPPPLQLAMGSVPVMVRENFDDADYTRSPGWLADSVRGARLAVVEGAALVRRTGARGTAAAAGLVTTVRIPVRRETAIQFDVRVDSASVREGCGINCALWPAMVRVRVRNHDLTESEAWFAFGTSGGQGGSLGGVTIVAKGDAVPGQWLRRQRFVIRDHLPRAETITMLAIGGAGSEFSARFDNITLPVGTPASIVVRPDTVRFTVAGDTARLVAAVKDSLGAALTWVPVSWTTSDTMIARVDAGGLVTAVRPGRAVIQANGANLSATSVVFIRTPPPTRPPRRARPAAAPPATRP